MGIFQVMHICDGTKTSHELANYKVVMERHVFFIRSAEQSVGVGCHFFFSFKPLHAFQEHERQWLTAVLNLLL